MIQKWDERYKGQEFAYGKEPNMFFAEWIHKWPAGSILMPADGEGRNGVFAATLGWQVSCFDLSLEGQSKALQLASENGVTITYTVGDFEQLIFPANAFDAIGLIYAHFSADKKAQFHRKLDSCLKPGGYIIFEAFSKQHLKNLHQNPAVGGPKELAMLYSESEIRNDFSDYEILQLCEQQIELSEGKYHVGTGHVVRFVGRKRIELSCF